VGIGTSSPGARLDVRTTSSTQATFTRTGQTAVCTLFQSSADTYLSATNSGANLILATQDTERARFNSTGAFVLAGGTTTADGIGITFPATQSASTNANTLDDYEEGTWTPSLGGTTTYTRQNGQYVKIGSVVTVWFDLIVSTIGTGSTSQISGLPFACGGTIDGKGGGIGFFSNLALSVMFLCGRVDVGNTTIQIGGYTAVTVTLSSSIAIFGNGARMVATVTYTV
jgi:hypothetical protein